MNIITNNQPRPLISFTDLTEKEKKDFDYIKTNPSDDDDDGLEKTEYRFFRYKGNAYDVYEFASTDSMHKDDPMRKNWDGYSSDTYFSGVLIKHRFEDDAVIVGRYYC